MSSTYSICVKCGAQTRLVDGRLCPQCYIETYGLGYFPKTIRLTICSRCGAYRFQGRWYPASNLEDALHSILQVVFHPREEVEYYRVEGAKYVHDKYHGDYVEVIVAGKLRGFEKEYQSRYAVRISLVKQICPTCFRKAAGSFSAVIQIRGWDNRLPHHLREEVLKILNSLPASIQESIVEVNEVREGIDLKLLDQSIARTIASKLRSIFAAKITESHKVVGRRSDGKRLSRLTLSVRLPFFSKGSLVVFRGELAKVVDIRGGYVYVTSLSTNKTYRLSIEESWSKLSQPRLDNMVKGVIAAVTPSGIHVQLLEGAYDYIELPRNLVRTVDFTPEPGMEVVVAKLNKYWYLFRS